MFHALCYKSITMEFVMLLSATDSFAYLFRKLVTQKLDKEALGFHASHWVLRLLTADSLQSILPELLADRDLQLFLRNNLRHFKQLLIVSKGRYYQTHGMNRQAISSELERKLLTSCLDASELIHTEQGEKLYFYHFVIEGNDSHALGGIWVATSKSISDIQNLKTYFYPLLSALAQGIQSHDYHQQALATAIKNEKQAQAADLHDTLAQVLSYVNFKTSNLNKLCQNVAEYRQLSPSTNEIQKQISYANRLTRELINSSRIDLSKHQLSADIVSTIDEYAQLSSIVFDVDNRCKNQLDCFANPNEVLLIVRESLNNLVRHSHATHARILILNSPHGMQLLIEDNGVGINHTHRRNDSHGLRIMQERAQRIGALFSVDERQEGGTIVSLLLDLETGL